MSRAPTHSELRSHNAGSPGDITCANTDENTPKLVVDACGDYKEIDWTLPPVDPVNMMDIIVMGGAMALAFLVSILMFLAFFSTKDGAMRWKVILSWMFVNSVFSAMWRVSEVGSWIKGAVPMVWHSVDLITYYPSFTFIIGTWL